MSENPIQAICKTYEKISQSVQTHLSNFISLAYKPSPANEHPSFYFSSPSIATSSNPNGDSILLKPTDGHREEISAAPVTKEELGRATWTFIHTLGAQYPDKPTRQQKRDVKELMAILSRMYPCKECADHFKEVLRKQILHSLVLKLSFPSGYVASTMLLTGALISDHFHVSELMQGGES